MRDAGLRLSIVDLYNELAFLCHSRQISMRKTHEPNVFRYQFVAFQTNPIDPLVMDPSMAVDDFLALVAMPYTTDCRLHQILPQEEEESDDETDQPVVPTFTRFAHPFITDTQANGEYHYLHV